MGSGPANVDRSSALPRSAGGEVAAAADMNAARKNPSPVLSTIHLDAVRGIAALAVVAYHIRYKFFFDYSEATGGLLSQLFYAMTSFGHDAVMVFFVLSGYLISGTILKDVIGFRWSWPRYLLNRLTRLYVVLLPGLALTVFWDVLGLRLFPLHPAYTGFPQAWKHDFFNVSDSLSPAIFFANLGFMHAIAGIPPLGSNSPLWSLTNEFAYYLLFPVMLLTFWSTTNARARLVYGAAAALLVYHFGSRILLYFPIWLFGVALRFVPPLRIRGHRYARARNVAVFIVVVGVTALRHTSWFTTLAGPPALELGDYLVGFVFATGLYVLLLDYRIAADGFYEQFARGTANISYTLYVVHMPLLIFLRAMLNDGRPWGFGLSTVLAALLLFAATLLYASVVWYLFEARTNTIRELVSQSLMAFRSLVWSGA
jgi:peptidoglycan/LPS O-acetylase OafA/YrhL